jgi:AcrR family transcriptional regulator
MEFQETLRDRIIRNSRELFLENGFSSVTTDDIARQLSISKRTLYEHFSSKDEIFGEVVNQILDEIEERINSIVNKFKNEPEVSVIEQIIDLWKAGHESSMKLERQLMIEIKTKRPDIFARIEDFRKNQFKKMFYEISEKSRRQGLFRSSFSIDAAYIIIYAAFEKMMSLNVLMEHNISMNDYKRSIFDILFNGLLTDKGRIEYQKIFCNDNFLQRY